MAYPWLGAEVCSGGNDSFENLTVLVVVGIEPMTSTVEGIFVNHCAFTAPTDLFRIIFDPGHGRKTKTWPCSPVDIGAGAQTPTKACESFATTFADMACPSRGPETSL